MVLRMATKTTLNLDELEYVEAQMLARANGMTVGEYVTRALRDSRLRAWHHRLDRDLGPPSPSAHPDEEREREPGA